MRFGFAGESEEMPFSEAVAASLKCFGGGFGCGADDPRQPLQRRDCVEECEGFVAEGVDLVIEFQIEERVAPLIAHTIARAGIPLIAVDIPHPSSVYFGVDNFQVGFEAGELLAQHAVHAWKSKVDWVLGLDVAEAGTFVQSRITGAFEGVRTHLTGLLPRAFVRLDGRGLRQTSAQVVKEFLERHGRTDRVLIAAATDTSALGALQVVRELGREKYVAIVGQDCIPEASGGDAAQQGPAHSFDLA